MVNMQREIIVVSDLCVKLIHIAGVRLFYILQHNFWL